MQTLFKNPEYHFLVESTKIENATFPYKAALSEANFKGVFFQKLFQLKNLV